MAFFGGIVAEKCGVPARTVRDYFTVLEETLVGTLRSPYGRTSKRKPITVSKFYFFDVGVGNSLAGRTGIKPGTEPFGKCFEVFNSLRD